jgi:ankyrin repeat protein
MATMGKDQPPVTSVRRRHGGSLHIFLTLTFMLTWIASVHSLLGAAVKRHHRIRCRHYISMELEQEQDTRPFEQRADGPRLARRLNHGFKHLFRDDASLHQNMTSLEYLCQYYPEEHVHHMNQTFPPLLDLDVARHLHPKMRFLYETIGISNISKFAIPPQYFGARLERTIAPRHAFLVYKNLPHGRQLMDSTKWQDFLLSSRKTKRFCALCNQWKAPSDPPITAKQIEAFDAIFGRGLLAAARDDLCQWNNTWPLQHINITSPEVIRLLVQHGANPLERDNRGVSLLHWATGSGNLGAVEELLPSFPKGVEERAERDGAKPLHWAAAGANAREFGTGGHPEVCRILLSACKAGSSNSTAKQLVNQLTFDGNSPLMWASWSGTLETVKMMVRERADPKVANRNGCTVAHWASSGGNLEVCKYLADVVGVDFFLPNHGGNTPLTHAVAFGRVEIVQWLKDQGYSGDDDKIAATLARDFVDWTDGDVKRKQVLQLFRDDYWDEGTESEYSVVDINSEQELELSD